MKPEKILFNLFFLILLIAGCQSTPEKTDNKAGASNVSITDSGTQDPPSQTNIPEEIPLQPEAPPTPPIPKTLQSPPGRVDAVSPPPSPARTPVPPAKETATTQDVPDETKVAAPVNVSQPETGNSKTTENRPDVRAETNPETTPPAEPQGSRPPSHDLWDQLLRQYVSSTGKVNYRGIKSDKEKLRQYLSLLKENPPAENWSGEEKLAFWINAYNAFTVKLITDNYPVNSIRSLEGGNPWKKKWINIGDKTYSLDQIENEIIRPRFSEPRIHFALNCAAKSCPPLLNRAWTAENLEQQFEKQTKAFINNPDHNTISRNKVEVSRIFEWYAADFDNLVAFLNRYTETGIRPDAKITYREYDWSLNE